VTNDDLGVTPRIGYAIPIGEMFSFWPRAGVGIRNNWQNTSSGSPNPQCPGSGAVGGSVIGSRTTGAFDLQLSAPFLLQPAPHFFMGLGPYLATDLSTWPSNASPARITTYGIAFTIGGWIGGP